MGRKPIPEELKKTKVFLSVPNPKIWELNRLGYENQKDYQKLFLDLLEKYLEKCKK